MAIVNKTMVGAITLAGSGVDTYALVASDLIASLQNGSIDIACDTTTGAVTAELPAIADLPANVSHVTVCILDSGKNALANNITIQGNVTAADKINGADSVLIDLDSASVILSICGGTWVAANAAI